jgi:TatD DNase family protein
MPSRQNIQNGITGMEFIDTHSHIYLEPFDDDRGRVIAAAVEKGIRRILLPNIDTTSIASMNGMVKDFPGICFPMIGLHPTSVKENYHEEFEVIRQETMTGNYLAVGEIGIDLYWDKTRLGEQSRVFEQELDLALALHMPVVIHARESFDVIFEILQKYEGTGLRGVFHAFSGTPKQALLAVENGFFLGIGGMVTYRNSGLDKTVQAVDLHHMVLETDSPFLPPVPHRGKRNEPAFLTFVAETVARLKSVDIAEIAGITTENACTIFGLNHKIAR